MMREFLLASGKERDAKEPKPILVAPNPDKLPDDGILNFVVIEDFFDFADVPSHSVALVRPEFYPLLKLLAENAPLFNLEVRTLVGLGNVEYTVDFEAATWNLERVAYAPLLTDLRLEKNLADQLKAESASVHDVERSRSYRKDGTVKPHDAEVRSTRSDDVDDSSDDGLVSYA